MSMNPLPERKDYATVYDFVRSRLTGSPTRLNLFNGMVIGLVLQPPYVVKLAKQNNPGLKGVAIHQRIIKHEGIRGYWRGASLGMLKSGIKTLGFNTILLKVHHWVQKSIQRDGKRYLGVDLRPFLEATIVAPLMVSAFTPFERAAISIIENKGMSRFQVLQNINYFQGWQVDGLKHWLTTVMLLYSKKAKESYAQSKGYESSKELGLAEWLGFLSLSTLTITFATNPLDVMKTQVQSQLKTAARAGTPQARLIALAGAIGWRNLFFLGTKERLIMKAGATTASTVVLDRFGGQAKTHS